MNTPDEAIVTSRDSFILRMVRVWLDEEKTAYEILATNLPRETFPTESFGKYIISGGRLKLHFRF